MKKIIASAFLTTMLFASPATAAEKPAEGSGDEVVTGEDYSQPTCKDINKVESCIPLGQGSFDDVRKYKLPGNAWLVTVHDKDASGEFNPYYWAFLLKDGILSDLSSQTGGLTSTDVDVANMVVSSYSKGSATGETGSIDIYSINVEDQNLDELVHFGTDGFEPYVSETGDDDKAFGYVDRAKKYISDHKYNLKLVKKLAAKPEAKMAPVKEQE